MHIRNLFGICRAKTAQHVHESQCRRAKKRVLFCLVSPEVKNRRLLEFARVFEWFLVFSFKPNRYVLGDAHHPTV